MIKKSRKKTIKSGANCVYLLQLCRGDVYISENVQSTKSRSDVYVEFAKSAKSCFSIMIGPMLCTRSKNVIAKLNSNERFV